jgi:hypothetical protein
MAIKLEIPVEERGYILRRNHPNVNPIIFTVQRLSSIVRRNAQKTAIVKLYPNARFCPYAIWDELKSAWRVII